MFKLFVVVMLCVIALHACAAADVNIVTVHVIAPVERSFIAIRVNNFYDIYQLPFIVKTHYWSW